MRAKMSLQDLKDLWPGYDPRKFQPNKATNKGFTHTHKPSKKPSRGELTPAQWHRKGRGQSAPYNYKGNKVTR